MDLKDFRLGLLPWSVSPRLAIEAALVVALALSLMHSGALKQRLKAERAQHGEYIAQVTAAAVAQSAQVAQKEAEARELSAQIEALRESVDRRFPERPLDAMSPRVVVGVDMAGGPDRCVCSVVEFPGGRVVDSWEVGGKDG